ncbi:MAG TPA: STAS domain-containing protein [Polyangia bacterium]
MRVLVAWTEGVLKVQIAGELDVLSVPRLRAVIDPLLAQARDGVVVDIADLRLIDSSGVGVFVGLFRQLRASGRRFAVQGATEQPLSILRLMKLDRVFAEESPPSHGS